MATPSKREEMVNNGAVGQAIALLAAGEVQDRASTLGLLHILTSEKQNAAFDQAREQLLSAKSAPPHAPVNVLPILWSSLGGESNSGEQAACGILKNLCDAKSTQRSRDSVVKLMASGTELISVVKDGRTLGARSDAVATICMCLGAPGDPEKQQQHAAHTDDLKRRLGKLGCLDSVMALLSDEELLAAGVVAAPGAAPDQPGPGITAAQRESYGAIIVSAAQCLEQLSSVKENKLRLLQTGGIDVLSSILRRRGLPLQATSHAAGTLHSLMLPLDGDIRDEEMDDRLEKITSCGAIPQLLRIIGGGGDEGGGGGGGGGAGAKKKGKKKKGKKEPPLPPGMAEAQRSATGCLRQLSLLKANKLLIAEHGGIPPIVPLLDAKDEQTRANANGLLLSLGMEPSNRDLMKKAKVPDYITGICSYVGSTALDNAFAIQVM